MICPSVCADLIVSMTDGDNPGGHLRPATVKSTRTEIMSEPAQNCKWRRLSVIGLALCLEVLSSTV